MLTNEVAKYQKSHSRPFGKFHFVVHDFSIRDVGFASCIFLAKPFADSTYRNMYLNKNRIVGDSLLSGILCLVL